METGQDYLYAEGVLDLVRLSAEYCKFLEREEAVGRDRFVDVMRGLLPMLYLKASLLREVPDAPGFIEPCVTEEDYDYVRAKACAAMGDRDDYLDVFLKDFKYSDKPILCTVSENLADIYQSLRELVEHYRRGDEESMQLALAQVREQFGDYLGQTMLNALRALHDARFGEPSA